MSHNLQRRRKVSQVLLWTQQAHYQRPWKIKETVISAIFWVSDHLYSCFYYINLVWWKSSTWWQLINNVSGNPLLSQILKKMFGVTDLSEHDSCINFLFLCLKFYLHRCKFQQTNPNFVAFLKFVKNKRNIEYKTAESKGKLRQHFKKWALDLEAP